MNEISRKDFFKELFGFFKEEVHKGRSGLTARTQPFLPPPGIASLRHYLQSCTRCFDCVTACPPMALQVCRDRASELYGYPVIEPQRQLCVACDDYPCIESCPQEALLAEHINRVIPRAVIVQSRCLASQNHFCLSCLNACPPQIKAIALNAEGVPVIDAERCTGCGLCAQACPAPKNAIEFLLE